MDSSGEPVSKYRVKVLVPGRLEYILISGAPTYLGHRSLFFEQYFRGRKFEALRAPRDLLQIFPDAQPVQLITREGQSGLRTELPDYWASREKVIHILEYLSGLRHAKPMTHWQKDSYAAGLLAGAVRNDHV